MIHGYFRLAITLLLAVVSMALFGCGGGSSNGGLIGGGTAAISSSASLALALDKTTAAAGTDVVTATVTLTAASSTQPVNGVTVNVNIIYNGTAIGSVSGNTNTNGVAVIPVTIANVPADRTIYLQATSSGITSSSSLAVTVKAPVLGSTIPTTTSGSAVVDSWMQFVLQGDTLTFKDGLGNPMPATNITFTLTSQTGGTASLFRNGSTTPLDPVYNPTFTVTTDSTGSATTGLTAVVKAPGAAGTNNVVTFYYTITATYAGYTYTSQLSSQFTLAATAAPVTAITANPSSLTFANTDPAGTSKVVTISGGTAPYSISGTYPDQTVTLSGSTISVVSKSAGGATNMQSVITVADSAGSSTAIVISYTK